jgi:predicted nuclease of restriction endonuclease-like (RecB) superfamily
MAKIKETELAYTANLPGAERGDPTYFENELIDHLIGIVLELGAQFWVMRDRLAFLEEKLCEAGDISLEDLEQGRPSAELQARLQNERRAMIRQIYGRLYARSGGDAVDPVSAPMS